MNKILTAIVADQMASMCTTYEEEIATLTERFTELTGRELEVYTPSAFYDSEIKPGTELVLFDYGGMSIGNDLMSDNSRRLVDWAESNPNALVVVTSTFTFHGAVRQELAERGLLAAYGSTDGLWTKGLQVIPNVVCDDIPFDEEDEAKLIPSWWKAGLK